MRVASSAAAARLAAAAPKRGQRAGQRLERTASHQNSGLACSSDRRARIPCVDLPMAVPFGLGSTEVSAFTIAVAAQYFSARRGQPFVPTFRRGSALCNQVPLKPATLLPSSPTICRSGILKRLATKGH